MEDFFGPVNFNRKHISALGFLWIISWLLVCLATRTTAAGPCDCSVCGSQCSGNIECPSGQFLVSNGSDWGCVQCPSGYFCPGGRNASQPCPSGYYTPSPGRMDEGGCEKCPAGHYCPVRGEPPRPCDPGYYANSTGQTKCNICPEGSQCENQAYKPEKCPDGFYSAQGNSTCSICPAGYQCPNGLSPQACSEGFYATAKSSSCFACTTGSKCPSKGMAAPTPCPIGSYTNITGQTSCSDCEAGHSCLNQDASTLCPAGHFSRHGEAGCSPCGLGNYSEAGATVCKSCPAGQQCVDPAQPPVNCTEGTYSIQGQAACSKCDPGQISSPSKTSCLPCPAGYCPDSSTPSTPCPSGMYSTGGASYNCTACPAGSACADPAANPVPCSGIKQQEVTSSQKKCDESSSYHTS